MAQWASVYTLSVGAKLSWREGTALFFALNGQAVGIWSPRTRWWAAAGCVTFHLGVGLTMRITPRFALLMWLHLPLALSLPPLRPAPGPARRA